MIVDTFQFFNELDVLEMRLKNLDQHVDIFVLAESRETHAGNPKPLYYELNQDRFKPWAHKIRHIICPPCPTSGLWYREKHQRDCVLLGFDNVPDDATVMISDVDEIPDMTRVIQLEKSKTHSIHMWMFEFSFDYMFTGEPWFGTVVTNAKAFRQLRPNFFRDNRWTFSRVMYAGWHCSSFGDANHVWHKLQNYAHAEDDKHKHQTVEQIREYVSKGIHADGTMKLVPRPDNIPLPMGV